MYTDFINTCPYNSVPHCPYLFIFLLCNIAKSFFIGRKSSEKEFNMKNVLDRFLISLLFFLVLKIYSLGASCSLTKILIILFYFYFFFVLRGRNHRQCANSSCFPHTFFFVIPHFGCIFLFHQFYF